MRRAFLSGPHLAYVRPPAGSDPFPWPSHLRKPVAASGPTSDTSPPSVVADVLGKAGPGAAPSDLSTRWAMASDLSPALQLALLGIRWTNLAKACAMKMRIEGVWVCGADRMQLRRAGLAVPTPGKNYDTLTPQGRWKADEAAKLVAKQYGLHVITRGGGFRSHTIRCSCGWSTAFTCSPAHKNSSFEMWELRHLQQTENQNG